ncbi:outer membrane beta-barrel protein [Flagellimonas myxillae]|uniref:outer membrane beta-barrel protein n=1 Tax=Flagellimonas myxillae TaxID=2942214 RepID=UPI00201E9304|nr:outer membrane beta-barrel protein [Muricauda myxillae]MCL6266696.1 outer membrane beta-barrel protein [Muricauda myxillae]
MGKKNLEQMFKERLGDYQELPDDKVWKAIEASLDKKKQKKRVVPLWWRLGGVAAVFAILLYVINPLGGTDGEEQITVTEIENPESSGEKKADDDVLKSTDPLDQENAVADQDDNRSESMNDAVADVEEGSGTKVIGNQSQLTQEQLAVSDAEQQTKNTSLDKQGDGIKNDDLRNVSTAIAENGNNQESELEKQHQKDALQNPEGLETSTERDAIAENVSDKAIPKQENALEQTTEETVVAQTNTENPEEGKQSIYDAIAEHEDEVVAQGIANKWSIGPSVAPVYFSASGEGSPVHSSFASNSKSGNVDLSYGLTVAYEVTKKLKVRTGVHRVNFGYDTNDVVFTSSFDGSINLIDNIDYSQQSQNIVLESRDKGALSLDKEEVASAADAILDGKMIQNLGYLEIPLELNYSLIDKKLGVDLIGGISSLFLVDNSVLLESEGLVTEVGEANNANSMNFSTNIGLGFNYEFSPKVQLNLEPVFKYQLNTFSDTSGSFRPFSVGVYSGFRLKF